MRLFVYGELCKPEVLLSVLDRVPAAELAVLAGYRRVRDHAGGYFHAVPSTGGVVAGMLLTGIGEAEMRALDRFEDVEGGEYRRVELEVRLLADDRVSSAWVYL